MRWRFVDPSTDGEAKERQKIVDAIARWWDAFASHAGNLELGGQRESEQLAGWVNSFLGPISSGIAWEFGREGAQRRLVLSVEDNRGLKPLLDEVVRRAPAMPGWAFYAARPAEPWHTATLLFRARESADLGQVRFQAGAFSGNFVSLAFRTPANTDDIAFNRGVLAANLLLGEECLYRWIRPITAEARNRRLFGLLPPATTTGFTGAATLKAEVDARIAKIREGLPPVPYCEWAAPTGPDQLIGKVFRTNAATAPDYSDRRDLIVASSPFPEMWEHFHVYTGFASERYSRHGELICYLKIEGDHVMRLGDVASRDALSTSLDEALVREKLGVTLSGGMGHRYGYIDLALTDVAAAIPRIVDVMRKRSVAKRSWLLFFEPELAQEWVGVWPDTPPPP